MSSKHRMVMGAVVVWAGSVFAQVPFLEQARSTCASRMGASAASVVEMTSRQGELPTLGSTVYTYKFADALTANTCAIDLDTRGREINASTLISNEINARYAAYGCLKPEQFNALAELPNLPIGTTLWAKRPVGVPDFRRTSQPYASKKAYTASFLRALIDRLRTQFPNSAPVAIEAAFAVRAQLTPSQVRAVSRWTDVDEVMTGDNATLLAVPAWYGTHNLARAHTHSDGARGRLGIVEFGIWQSAPYLPSVSVLANGGATDSHATEHLQTVVGQVSNTTTTGAAPGTSPAGSIFYHSASRFLGDAVQTSSTAVATLLQIPTGATDVINMSYYVGLFSSGGQAIPTINPEAFGRYCDEQAFDFGTTFVAGTGNWATRPEAVWKHVPSPANGLNVIAVGWFADNRTPAWEDDSITPDSAWKNPPGVWGDRAKPDLMVSGDPIRAVDSTAPGFTSFLRSGGSFAAPVVSGTVGLMNDQLRYSGSSATYPVEIVRSVLLATALNNVDRVFTGASTGYFSFPWTHLSELDGAGGLDSGAALDVTALGQYGLETYGTCKAPQSRQLLSGARFDLRYGQRARAAVAWSSLPTALSTPTADLDVMVVEVDKVTGATLRVAAWSGSMESNAEMVGFTAERTGTYQVYLLTRSCAQPPMYVGYSWWIGP